MTMKRIIAAGLSASGILLATVLASAAGQYGPGASDTEVKIGNTMPYSGPASAYGIIGKTEAAYFTMINEQGGINGRKINFISRDDGYSPPKTVELVRRMVEEDQVLFLFSTLGTPTNTAIHSYLKDNKVPQLFAATGADQWNDPKLSLDDGPDTELRHRGSHLRTLHPQAPSECENRGALSE